MTHHGGMHAERGRAESFGSVAESYDAVRPTYPDALLVELTTRGGVDVLDVGCGTGIAARLLAERGMHVLGVEIDPAMAAVARRRGTEVEIAKFEEWDDAGRRFDLLTCAQAWHWVEPAAGAAAAARVLRPGGSVGLFWNMSETDPALRPAVDEVYAREAPDLFRGRHGEPIVAPMLDALGAAGFGGLTTREFPWERTLDAARWIELLSTYSDHNTLPPERRAALLVGLREAVGEQVVIRYATRLVSAFWQG